ncbi:hypothetical protein [Microbacterium aurantiacum]|uniref:GGDEF domain-containing protein n=1 Tax=Microbacterium aurantiacum TaxID=162393 RepID=A0ABT8FP41_9MICO|nr:hypothetical protein [Microbacterium aurantiacum]MDN4463098.1 hypothetical protein [Microbacterium aurantiacum]
MDVLQTIGTSDLGIWQAAFAAVATSITVGIAFLRAPSRATLYWTYAFTLALVSTFGVIAAQIAENESGRVFSLGLLLGAPATLWSGFRAYRGVRAHIWVGPALALLIATILTLAADMSWFTTAYRVSFLLASLSGGLFLWEWSRMPNRADPVIWPFGVVSVLFVALGVVGALVGLTTRPIDEDFTVTRPLSALGMLIYIVAALIAILGLTVPRRAPTGSTPAIDADFDAFRAAAGARLERALPVSEVCSLLVIRVDDLPQLRTTLGGDQVGDLTARVVDTLRCTAGAGALVAPAAEGVAVALVARPEGATRDLLRRLLRAVGDLEVDSRLPVQLSASAGWCSTTVGGYDLDALVFIARGAAEVAQERGGDQWERADGTFIERLVTGLEAQ